eukprot:scaffold4503_cov167-Amphora_coffeaeformis.AAC.10
MSPSTRVWELGTMVRICGRGGAFSSCRALQCTLVLSWATDFKGENTQEDLLFLFYCYCSEETTVCYVDATTRCRRQRSPLSEVHNVSDGAFGYLFGSGQPTPGKTLHKCPSLLLFLTELDVVTVT